MNNPATDQRPSPCKAEGCSSPPSGARGFCPIHYRRFIRDGGLGRICALPDCDGGTWANGLCAPHAGRARRYGLSVEDLVLIDAREVCDICGSKPPEAVDHDHLTGVVRGVLCGPCNRALGLFRDDFAFLVAAIHYLTSPPGA